ncbi:tetratricopeptide repeat protein [Dethiosulfatarculus sandiegensis]|uniref:Uncharacterized protein n=1 Tax=Dethiosulfatarculus sandiegensis TaxID=1429043 RepID=A0A0D2IYT5_9BACT|nr:tetratricopeptide repeat protein [Dethiosulfatarculus sandiegensis]KIX11194.1 hypothetical protein X474_25220 [Dethiosulfatarculus sandiegensis]
MGVKIDLEDALCTLEDMRHEDIDEGVANALLKVGVAYLERGKDDLAFEALDEAYYLCKKLENDTGRAQVCLRLADVAWLRGNWLRAEELLREALIVFEQENDVPGCLGAFERLCETLSKAGRYDQAKECLIKALKIAEKGNDVVGRLFLIQRLAPLYRAMGQLDRAEDAYRELGKLAHEMNDPQRVALALVGLGTCQAEQDRKTEAAEILIQARDVFLSLGQMNRASQVEEEMRRLGCLAQNDQDTKEERGK